MTNRLQWDVFVSAQIPVVTDDLPPGANEMKWVDTAITVDQNQKLADWIAGSGKNLTAIYRSMATAIISSA